MSAILGGRQFDLAYDTEIKSKALFIDALYIGVDSNLIRHRFNVDSTSKGCTNLFVC